MVNKEYIKCSKYFKGVNLLTPYILGYYKTPDYVIELSNSSINTHYQQKQLIHKTCDKISKNKNEAVILNLEKALTILWHALEDMHNNVGVTVYDIKINDINHALNKLCTDKNILKEHLNTLGIYEETLLITNYTNE